MWHAHLAQEAHGGCGMLERRALPVQMFVLCLRQFISLCHQMEQIMTHKQLKKITL